jgi:hypothetical protein
VSNYNKALAASPQFNNLGTHLGARFMTALITSLRLLIVWLCGGLNSHVFVAVALRKANRSNTFDRLLSYSETSFYIFLLRYLLIIAVNKLDITAGSAVECYSMNPNSVFSSKEKNRQTEKLNRQHTTTIRTPRSINLKPGYHTLCPLCHKHIKKSKTKNNTHPKR